jgi:hypothetical protein
MYNDISEMLTMLKQIQFRERKWKLNALVLSSYKIHKALVELSLRNDIYVPKYWIRTLVHRLAAKRILAND